MTEPLPLHAAAADAVPHPWLVADIGGTNARFGWIDEAGGPILYSTSLPVGGQAGPLDAARAYLAQVAQRLGPTYRAPGAAAWAVATAIVGDEVGLTNAGWRFSRRALRRELGLRTFVLLNDFEALALSLPLLGPGQLRRVGEAAQQVAVPLAARAVIGPGTGLGVAGLVPCPTDAAEPGEPPRGSGGPPQAVQAVQAVQAGQAGQAGHDEPAEPSRAPAGATRWLAIAGEGGHVSLAADDDFESTLLAAVRRQHAHVSAERLLSGIGLPDLHQAVAQVRGAAAPALRTEAIVAAGLAAPGESGADALCRETLEHFCALLGGFAGNVALTLGARGGVYIGGGIVPRLGDLFLRSRFRTRFEAKGRFTDYLRAIPTWVIVDTQVALSGAAMALQQRRAG